MNMPLIQQESTALQLVAPQQWDLSPRNFEEAWRLANLMAESEMVPKDFKMKPGNCLIAVQWGAEIGLKAMQAVQNIAIINGRPSLWGDVMLALVRANPLCEYVVETPTASGCVCRVKRRGEPEQSREFTVEDAREAGLLNKDGPWKQYRKRMLQMRARGWALRDVFTDVLRGLSMAEEAMDMPPLVRDMGPADIVGQQATAADRTGGPSPASAGAPPAEDAGFYPAADFEKNFTAWKQAIEVGTKTKNGIVKRTAADIIAMVSTKHPLSDAQQQRLRDLEQPAPHDQPTDVEPRDPGAIPPGNAAAGGPPVSFAYIAGLLINATNDDEVAAAEDLIGSIEKPALREELVGKAKQRRAELGL